METFLWLCKFKRKSCRDAEQSYNCYIKKSPQTFTVSQRRGKEKPYTIISAELWLHSLKISSCKTCSDRILVKVPNTQLRAVCNFPVGFCFPFMSWKWSRQQRSKRSTYYNAIDIFSIKDVLVSRELMKMAKMIPLYTSRGKNQISNYRPFSLLPDFKDLIC